MKYAIITDDPRLVWKLKKKYDSNIKSIIIIIELDKPSRVAPWAQRYNIKIKKLDLII